jgi:hypothetical protein
MSGTETYDVSVDLNNVCQNYLIGKVASLKMKKGLNVWFLNWDTSDSLEPFKIFKTLTIELLKNIKTMEMKDLDYSDIIDNQIKVEHNEKTLNINFESLTCVSDDLVNKMNSLGKTLAEMTNSKVDIKSLKLPLYVLLVDTENPQYGELCNVNDIRTIFNILCEMITKKFE